MNSNKIENTNLAKQTTVSPLSNESSKPLIFTKKVNDKYKIIPLKANPNTLGLPRHFPPANKEWLNSIYAYSSNYLKSLPIADKNILILIKSYFNLFNRQHALQALDGKKSKNMRIRFRRASVKKIFVSKAELKHTSSKVIITLYVYNKEKEILLKKIKKLEKLLFSKDSLLGMDKFKPLSFKDKFKLLNIQKKSLMNLVNLEKDSKDIPVKAYDNHNNINISLYNELTQKYLERELIIMTYYKAILDLNKLKFEDAYLLKLSNLISKIYNKDVEFNIVSLKSLYLNSDILSEAVILKIKNRRNKLLRVLRSALGMVKIPLRNRFTEKIVNQDERVFLNKVQNMNLLSSATNSLPAAKNLNVLAGQSQASDNQKNAKDSLTNLLLGIFSTSNGLPFFINSEKDKSQETIEQFFFNNLKHKAIGGIRLEAKGRLTRRFTASRSVFKVRWKGSLKNIDSSYRGLSAVMLRGHVKSNLQYTMTNSKTRNGSFGLKGWVSSKS